MVFMKAYGATVDGPIALQNLPYLKDARLSIQATLERRGGRLHEFSAAISGLTPLGVAWTAAVHLDNELKRPAKEGWRGDWCGAGACSHAILHCHVGPDLSANPKVRVPLPALGPEHALDWLLATVVPHYEPVPWDDVQQHLNTAGK